MLFFEPWRIISGILSLDKSWRYTAVSYTHLNAKKHNRYAQLKNHTKIVSFYSLALLKKVINMCILDLSLIHISYKKLNSSVNYNKLIDEADKCLYKAKNSGKGRYIVFK